MIYRFFHMLGFALWMGGALLTMALVIRAGKEEPAVRSAFFRVLPVAHGVIGLGALITVLTGVPLAIELARLGALAGRIGLHLMMTAGVLAWLIGLFVVRPAALRISEAAAAHPAGDFPPHFEALRRRLAIGSSLAGVLGLIALAGATLV